MEGAQGLAIGGGAFRKHQQRMLLLQVPGHLLANQLAVTRTAADKQAAGLGSEPAGHGPGADLGLGQKGQRRQPAEQGDIGPGTWLLTQSIASPGIWP